MKDKKQNPSHWWRCSSAVILLLGLFALIPAQLIAGGFIINGATVTLANNVVLTSTQEVTLTSGGLVANGAEIIVGSTWTRTNGNFTYGNSTVTFAGAGLNALVGSTTFYNLRAIIPGQTLKFTAGTTQYVTHQVTFQDNILRSTTNNATWYIQYNGTSQILDAVDVKDSNASGGSAMNATNSVNSGNNTNWTFISIDVGERYWVASTAGDWNNSANWSLSSNGSGGAQVPLSTHNVILNGAGGKNGNVLINTSITVTTLTISGYTGTFNTQSYNLTVSSSFSQSSGNIQLGTSVFTLQGDFVKSGGAFDDGTSTISFTGGQVQTLTPGGTAFYHVAINKSGGSLNLNENLIVDGNWVLSAGTFNAGTSTVTFDTAVNRRLYPNGQSFYRLAFNGTGSWTLEADLTATGQLSFTDGTLNTSGNNWSVTASSDVVLNGGTLTLNASTMSVAGHWTKSAGSFNAGTSTITFIGTSNQNLNSGGSAFAHLTTDKSGGTFSLAADFNLNGNFTKTLGIFNSAGYAMSVAGNWFNSGTFTGTNSTVTFNGATTQTLSGSSTFYALKALTPNATLYFTPDTTNYVTNLVEFRDLTLRSVSDNTNWYFKYSGSSQTLVNLQVRDSNAFAGSVMLCDLSSVDLGNNGNWAFGDKRFWAASGGAANWSSAANWSLVSGGTGGASVPTSTHTVIFNGVNGKNATCNIDIAATAKGLDINGYQGTINGQTFSLTLSSGITQTSGTYNLGSSTITINNGDLNLVGGTFIAGASTLAFSGGSDQIINTAGTRVFNIHINKTGGTAYLASPLISTGNLNVTLGTFDSANWGITITSHVVITGGTFNLNNSTMSVQRNWTRTGGTFNAGGSTVSFIGGLAQTVVGGGNNFNHLVVDKTGATTLSLGGAITANGGIVLINGTLDATAANHAITSGRLSIQVGTTLNGRSSQIMLTGTTGPLWNHAGTFTTTASTVTFNPDSNVTLTNGTIGFNHVQLAPSLTDNRIYEMGSGDLTLNGNFTIVPNKISGGDATLTVNMGGAITVAAANATILDGTGNANSILDTIDGSNYTLTTGRIEIRARATLNGRAAAINLIGTTAPLWNQTGAFNSGFSVVTATANLTVNPVTSGSITFYDLVFSPQVSGNRVYTLGSSSITVLNNFTVNPAGSANSLTVNLGAPMEVGAMTTIQRTGALATAILTATAGNHRFTTGNMTIATGGTFNATGSSVTFTGTTPPLINRVGTFTQGTSTVTITSQASVTLTNATITFVHLIIDTPGQTQTLGAATTLSGNLIVNNGELSDGGFQITGNAANRLILGSGTQLTLGSAATATTFPATYVAARIALDQTSTVTYNSGQAQTISGTPTYGNLALNAPANSPTKTQGAAVVATGNLTIGTNNTYDVGATNLALSIGGSYSNSGIFNARSGTVTFTAGAAGFALSGNMINSSSFSFLTFNGSGGEWTLNSPMVVISTLTVTAGTLQGTGDATVFGGIVGHGTNGVINMTGGTFEQRVAGNKYFGSNVAGANNWTFNNLTFSNSSGANRIITTSPNGTGSIIISGVLVVGNPADGFQTTFNNQSNNRALRIDGDTLISSKGILQASQQPLLLGGDWTNNGTFTTNSSTLTLTGASTQRVNNHGKAFANVISSNTSAGGVIFSSSFSATRLFVNTADLNSSATIYFAANSTFTISTFTVIGTAPYSVVLRSTDTGSYWYLNNTSTNSVGYVSVEDSNADQGLRIFNHPGGVNINHNSNWAFGSNPPTGLGFTDAQTTSLSLSWTHIVPPADSYTLNISTNQSFVAPATNVSTALDNATTSSLLINTTYHARINSIVQGVTSSWSSDISTATKANPPVSAASTWTAVNFTSVTVTWLENSNPLNVTQYAVQLSTVQTFDSGNILSTGTTNLQVAFENLDSGTTYYAQAKAINHSGISTQWIPLGSTVTMAPQTPTNFHFTAAQPTSLTAAWNLPSPAGETYTLQVSTDSNFNGTLISSVTKNLFATTITPLEPNTTYYGQVKSINFGISSPWSNQVTTATLANIPLTAVSTWTAINYSSLTVTWQNNSNPLNVTQYVIELSTVQTFDSGDIAAQYTTNLEATFEMLDAATTYYAQVKAVNHSGLFTNYTAIGSTKTLTPITCNAATTGNWDSAGTWVNCTGLGGLPSITDVITINSGVTVTLNVNATVGGIVFAAPGANNSLVQLSTVTLTVNGPVTFNQPTVDSRTNSWNINAGTATINGLISFAGSNATVTRISQILITAGQLNAYSGISFTGSDSATKIIDMSGGAGQLNLKGNLSLPANSGTLNAGSAGSRFNYADDSAGQTVRFFTAGAYHNLYVNNTSASGATLVTAVSAANVTADVRVQSGTLKNGGFAIVGGAGDVFEVANGATFEMSGTSSFPSGFATITLNATSRVRYLQTTDPLTISNQTYGHLDLMPSGAATQQFPAGPIIIQGDLSIGDGSIATVVSADTNDSTVQVDGDLLIQTNATLVADNTNPLFIKGDWSNGGTFTHNDSTVSFTGSTAQYVNNIGKAFANLISSNPSTGGLVFSSSFSAARLFVNTADLNSGATLYFAGGSTFTISTFSVTGGASYPVVLRSTNSGTFWYLNNTSINAVSYVQVKDSNALSGRRIFDYPGGVDLGNILNWAMAVNTPSNFAITGVSSATLSASWDAPNPTGDTYTFQVSTATNFSGTLTSSNTANLLATSPASLIPNTTYYGQVKSVISSVSSSWSAYETAVTLATTPATVASTWTAVNLTSVTVAWSNNGNPLNVTEYIVQLATSTNFDGAESVTVSTYSTSTTFETLDTAKTYFVQAKAVNHSGINTDWFSLGSTNTITPTVCSATNTVGTSNWNVGGNWLNCTGPGGIPGATDVITINAGVNLILNVNATVGGITFATVGTANSFTQLSTVTLTVNGNVTMVQPTTTPRTVNWNINESTATVYGLISFTGTTAGGTRVSRIVINSGQLNAFGGMSFAAVASATKVIFMSGGPGTLNLKGNLTIPPNSCTLTAGVVGSVFNYMDDSAAQTVRFFTAGAYHNLHLNNTFSSGVTLGSTITAANVTANTKVLSGVFKSTVPITGGAGDTFEVSDGAVFEMSGSTIFPTGYSTTTLAPTSRVRYLQTLNPLNISAQLYGHLDLMPAGTATQNFPAGAITVQGDLSIGNGSNAATISANANNTTLTVGGNLAINSNAIFIAHASNLLKAGGDWSNNGTFTHNNSTVSFTGSSAQYVNNRGKAFANVITSNTSNGGVVFSSSFSAARFFVNTAELNSSATVYFEARSTFTISTFSVIGTSPYPVVLRSTDTGVYWHLNNTSTHSVRYAFVEDSNASSGIRILDNPGGADLGHNLNWAIGLNPPANLEFSDIQISSLTLSWPQAIPAADTYTLHISTNDNFSNPVTIHSTALLSATTSGLIVDTTYYARLHAVISGAVSAWTSDISTATRANMPATAASTWTAVNFTSVTVAWLNNGNPLNVTTYQVQLSTVNNFLSGVVHSSNTTNLNTVFSLLVPSSTYFTQVRAINRSGYPTNWLFLGSTVTLTVNTPAGLFFSSAAAVGLSAMWNASSPLGDTYHLQVSTAQNFSGTITSSNTALLIATTTANLSVNTTYYGRVNAIINGSSSPWSSNITTATLANAPATAVSTWTAVNITSITVTWLDNGNPLDVTQYEVQLSTVANFLSGVILSSFTTNLETTFDQLDTGTVYHAQVKAINHSGIATNWLPLGSTQTVISAIPDNLSFTAAQTNSLSAAWDDSSPAGDSFTFRVSTDSNFNGTVVSSSTLNLFATTIDPLESNSTYYGQARAIVSGTPYPWSAYITTATLANMPSAAPSTWTAVNITSLTVTWLNNTNPLNATLYRIQLSTVSNFLSGVVFNSTTTDLATTFNTLAPLATYYAQVRAVNHSGIPTNWLPIGSTITLAPYAPSNFAFTAASTNTLSASWNTPVPAGDSYVLRVSTDSNFNGTVVSSITLNAFATTSNSLTINTTYYGQVQTVLSGSSSAWTSYVTTATLAMIPATAVSTWSAVNLTSFTVTWTKNNNPDNVTPYELQISTSQSLNGEEDVVISTYGLTTNVQNLNTAATYYARVRAVNHSGINTDWLLLGSTVTLTPTTCNADTTGNWDDPNTWTNCTGPGGLPSATDIINIFSGVTVTLNVDAEVGGVIFSAPGAASNALTHSGTYSLTVNGPVTFNQPTTSSRNNSWNLNAGTATISGLISFLGSDPTSSKVSRIVLTSGELNAYGGISFTGSANATKLINMSGGAGHLNLKGNLTIPANSCTLSAGTSGSVFNYMDGSSLQTVRYFTGGAYYNLYLNNTSASGVVLGSSITVSNVTGDVRVLSGTLKNGAYSISGNSGEAFEVADGATFEMSGSTGFPSGFSTYTLGSTSRVRYLQTSTPLTVSAQTYGHLDLMPAGTATQNFPTGTFTVQGDLSIGNGSNSTTVSANVNNTTLSVGGNLGINNSAAFTANNSNTLTVGGNWSNNGTFNFNTSTVTLNGSATQTLAGSSTFYALRALTSNATLYFTAGTTQYITNMLDLENVYLRSTSDNATWYFKYSGSSQTLLNLTVQDSNASLGSLMQTNPPSANAGNNTRWDFGASSAVSVFSANLSTVGASLALSWTAPGEDLNFGTLYNSTFTIQYTTDTVFAEGNAWSPTSDPQSDVYRLHIATTNVAAGSTQGKTITGLISGGTYYFRIWTKDTNGNTSAISIGATNYATNIVLGVQLSTDTLTLTNPINLNTTVVISTGIVVTNTGNVKETYEFTATTATAGSPWQIATATATDRFVLWAIINLTEPIATDFGIEDKLIDSYGRCTSNAITNSANTCVSVPAGETRTIWFKLGMPNLTTTGDAQQIRITGKATVPD